MIRGCAGQTANGNGICEKYLLSAAHTGLIQRQLVNAPRDTAERVLRADDGPHLLANPPSLARVHELRERQRGQTSGDARRQRGICMHDVQVRRQQQIDCVREQIST